MVLKLYDGEEFYDVPISEGDVFLLPPHVHYSPSALKKARAAWCLNPNGPKAR